MQKLTDCLKKNPAEPPMSLSWSSLVATRLGENAGPVFARAERPTPEKAMCIRMAALCLATEADGMQRKDIGDMFRQLAVGITFLEHRATGQQTLPEVIMLALEPDP